MGCFGGNYREKFDEAARALRKTYTGLIGNLGNSTEFLSVHPTFRPDPQKIARGERYSNQRKEKPR